MTSDQDNLRPRDWWIALAVLVLGLVIYNFSLRTRQSALRHKIVEARLGIDALNAARKAELALLDTVWPASNANQRYQSDIPEMLQDCTSRDDFLLREGPQIAWGTLRSSVPGKKSIGIYLPPGKHWLRYASAEFVTRRRESKFVNGFVHDVEFSELQERQVRYVRDVKSCELGPLPEVYEVVISSDENEPLQLSVLGSNNQLVYADTFPEIKGVCTLGKQPLRGMVFPSELDLEKIDRVYFHGGALRDVPVAEVGVVEVQPRGGKRSVIRFWIESEADACARAISVARNFDKIRLEHRSQTPFKPYAGEDRYLFRDRLFVDRDFE